MILLLFILEFDNPDLYSYIKTEEHIWVYKGKNWHEKIIKKKLLIVFISLILLYV